MKITNKLGLPDSLVQMASQDFTVDPMTYRVTSLLKGIRETLLERRHEAEVDVGDMVWMLFGTAVHGVLEGTQETSTQIKETRLKELVAGRYVSGQFDLYDEADHSIADYKTCSVWKLIYQSFDDWRRQTFIYAYLMRRAGFRVDKCKVIAFIKDHSKREAKLKPSYPQYPVQMIEFTFTDKDYEETEAWLINRVETLMLFEDAPDDMLPLCTPEERYNDGDKYAVMKKNGKRAMRVLDTYEDAVEWMKANNGDVIEIRKSEDKKCIDYCSVCKFCTYWQEKYGVRNEESSGHND